jgi:heat shock protein HslJ
MVFLAIVLSGCTSQPASQPVATATAPPVPVQSQAPATQVPLTQAQAATTDPALSGMWYLKMMGLQGGTAPIQVMNTQITAIFDNQGSLSGFAGCNNYNAQYTLTGESLPNGKGITVGPIASTQKYCADTGSTETQFLQILQKAKSYTVNAGELTITDSIGSVLVFQRTPYGQAAVPAGS